MYSPNSLLAEVEGQPGALLIGACAAFSAAALR
jgi:hypothetical protein